jgi:hypothetical protein
MSAPGILRPKIEPKLTQVSTPSTRNSTVPAAIT